MSSSWLAWLLGGVLLTLTATQQVRYSPQIPWDHDNFPQSSTRSRAPYSYNYGQPSVPNQQSLTPSVQYVRRPSSDPETVPYDVIPRGVQQQNHRQPLQLPPQQLHQTGHQGSFASPQQQLHQTGHQGSFASPQQQLHQTGHQGSFASPQHQLHQTGHHGSFASPQQLHQTGHPGSFASQQQINDPEIRALLDSPEFRKVLQQLDDRPGGHRIVLNSGPDGGHQLQHQRDHPTPQAQHSNRGRPNDFVRYQHVQENNRQPVQVPSNQQTEDYFHRGQNTQIENFPPPHREAHQQEPHSYQPHQDPEPDTPTEPYSYAQAPPPLLPPTEEPRYHGSTPESEPPRRAPTRVFLQSDYQAEPPRHAAPPPTPATSHRPTVTVRRPIISAQESYSGHEAAYPPPQYTVTTTPAPLRPQSTNAYQTQEDEEQYDEKEETQQQRGDLSAIPGEPGKDYPIMSRIPSTKFSCRGKPPGFYADMEHKCQLYYLCGPQGNKQSFLCPNGTIFNQASFVCEWYYNVDCGSSEKHYAKNNDLYKVPEPKKIEETNESEPESPTDSSQQQNPQRYYEDPAQQRQQLAQQLPYRQRTVYRQPAEPLYQLQAPEHSQQDSNVYTPEGAEHTTQRRHRQRRRNYQIQRNA